MSLSIFNYRDPSLYLRDAWNSKRVVNKNFTLRAWANQLGISSHGTFYDIVHGKRPLPKKYVRPISLSLKLTAKESLYLDALVEFSRAKGMEHKTYCQERLQELAPGAKLSFYEIEAFHFLKNPLNGAIIELTSLHGFVPDPQWIKDRLTIRTTLQEIQRSLDLMLELKLIMKNENGELKRGHGLLHTKQDIKNGALQEYHKNVLQLGAEQISTQDVLLREFNATALGIKKEDLSAIKEDLRNFLNEFIRKYEASEGTADEIYQLGMQFFALTNNKEKLQ